MRTVDLSHPITVGMPVYPGDPAVRVTPVLTIERDGAAVSCLELGSHTGTHIDAPAHFIPNGRTIDQVPLEWLRGEARVLRPRAKAATRIEPADLELPDRLPPIVLIDSGWAAFFGTKEALRAPALSIELARDLWDRGARVLGMDMMSPDAFGNSDVHQFWLGHDGVIVENLTGLTELPRTVQVTMLPLSLVGVDGAPLRAIAHLT